MRVLRVAVCLLGVFVGLAPAALADSHDLADRADAWEEAFAAGDLGGVADLYTEDARIMPPNAPMMQGRDGVAATFEGMKGFAIDLETVESATAGEMGYRVGTYVLQAPDGSTVDEGKFIEIWTKVDGRWMISDDIWNSDLPAKSDDDEDAEDDEAEEDEENEEDDAE